MQSFNEVFLALDNQDLNNKYNQLIEEFLVDELLDLKGLPEPEKMVEEKEQDSKEAPFIPFENNEALLLSEISAPEETESAYLEWLSRFVHDCHLPQPAAAPASTDAPALISVKGKRSKRRRSATVPWSLSVPLLLGDTSPVLSHTSFSSSSSFYQWQCTVYRQKSSFAENYMPYEPYLASIPQKRGRKPKKLCAGNGAGGERRCTHCGVQKTPQWRAGPGGPKTLCNACGVRFKSGRLLPEYRPACSPTFISKIHSNSHRKVLEMRQKKVQRLFTASAPAVHSC